MVKFLMLIIVILALNSSAKAQADPPKRSHTYRLGEKTIVKDSTGAVVPYATWQKMVASGVYGVRPVDFDRDDTEFLLFNRKTQSNTITYINKPGDKPAHIIDMPKPPESTFFKTGEKISSFSATDINGNKIKIKDLQGKIVVINFWFIGCPPCRMELPELNKLALEYANNPDVVFVAIGLDDKHDIQQFIKDNPFAYHLIPDGRIYADIYRLNLYPTNVVLDKEGKVRFSSTSYPESTPFWIKKTIEELK
ncbi:MAG: TlpA family protein disulfide reductase [Mucilaginibacter sp.]